MYGMLKSLLMIGACAGLFAFGAMPAMAQGEAANARPEPLVQGGRLEVQNAGGDDYAGQLDTPSGAMSFHTRSLSAGKAAAARTVPEKVQARLEVNGIVLDHEIDYAAGTLTVRTGAPVKIAPGDREVLRTFQNELGRSLPMQVDAKRAPKSLDLLWRLSEMYSEIPVGYELPREWVIERKASAPIFPAASGTGKPAPFEATAPVTTTACNERSGGSFTNLRGIVDVCDDDRTFYRSSSHDYCPAHGYTSSTVAYGCGANSCPGRCGAGCGVGDGVGAWYQDCLDHDVCNRTHDSQFGGCGDEWKEAADDYAFGTISCYTTCH